MNIETTKNIEVVSQADQTVAEEHSNDLRVLVESELLYVGGGSGEASFG